MLFNQISRQWNCCNADPVNVTRISSFKGRWLLLCCVKIYQNALALMNTVNTTIIFICSAGHIRPKKIKSIERACKLWSNRSMFLCLLLFLPRAGPTGAGDTESDFLSSVRGIIPIFILNEVSKRKNESTKKRKGGHSPLFLFPHFYNICLILFLSLVYAPF